ncbi:MAG: GIY-YIG nuclease family protein [Gammaproteobacteria bacterium]|nr:GIY-YIG nuclease family protein [Gammaproteobacteria bacterium]NNF60810.1 GIY-YIG nuclease family protein [Gammaproteobacteria bacterium]NNM21725.1 GIY-YIG nuclease family protein [Gammaproteobacteria bacterium]
MVRCADDSLYTGITTDLERRIAAHNDGSGSRYTRTRLPVGLVYSEQAASRGAALKREAAIKRMTSAAKRALVEAGCPA